MPSKLPSRVPLLALALAALALGGCASMGKDECKAIDWRAVGYEDGATGQGVERMASRRQACAKHGVTLDLDAYRAGREEGLREFCQPASGFRAGSRGRDFTGACPADLAPGFNDAYHSGRTLWRLESRVNDTARGIQHRRAQIDEIDSALVATTLAMVGDGKTPQERAQALLDSRSLTDRRGLLVAEIESLERALPGYEAELQAYRFELAQAGY